MPRSRGSLVAAMALVLATQSFPGVASSVADVGIQLVVNAAPMFAPDLNNPRDCSWAPLQVRRADGKPFQETETLTVKTRETGTIRQQWTYVDYRRDDWDDRFWVYKDSLTGQLPKSVNLNVQLCTVDLRDIDSGVPPFLQTTVTLGENVMEPFASTTLDIPVLPRTKEAAAAEMATAKCGLPDNGRSAPRFRVNLVIESVTVRHRPTSHASIKAVLLRHGLAAPNELLSLRLQRISVRGSSGKEVASVRTNSKGEFSISLPRLGPTYYLYAPSRWTAIPPMPGPFAGINLTLYTSNFGEPFTVWVSEDWIPLQPRACQMALNSYVQARASVPATIFDAHLHSGSLYTLIRRAAANRKRPTSSSYDQWKFDHWGRCFVNGYTTRKGKHVSSYWRSC